MFNGILTSRNVATQPGKQTGYGDLVAWGKEWRLLIEFEMGPRRVANDLRKAAELNAALWIVVPNGRVRSAVRRQLRRCGVREKYPARCVLTLGQAVSRVTDSFPFSDVS